MSRMNPAISAAIKTQATRVNVELVSLAEALGMSRSSLYYRLNDKKAWDIGELETVAHALKLPSAWELLELAETERRLEAVA
ncbi:hypothetical protein BW14_07180 [Bifidobacterium sp. UTBIF-68]|uniref:helix-turn-helix domain-containing protein n=1 Tax=Bifidobacterium sp. UTBIF-68 TaxID=1465262 RepID=UPI00112AB2EA|nr:helix-turn-helix domain-containing protein [Bifidobacterium sp. UTBIF-68]TPF92935.1 hypothetical protein BW14_07180 [Bifidobacterium sp. UTBIF-68]